MPMWTQIEGFNQLNQEEFDALIDAPALITILIGGADGNLDAEERHWSERLLRSRTYNKPKALNEFYRVVSEIFWVKVNGHLTELPADTTGRTRIISEALEKLNPILAKLDPDIASDLYHGFLGLAAETAVASGGFLRIGGVGEAEEALVKLPMLKAYPKPAKAKTNDEDEMDDEED